MKCPCCNNEMEYSRGKLSCGQRRSTTYLSMQKMAKWNLGEIIWAAVL